jgi:hypothetical protein
MVLVFLGGVVVNVHEVVRLCVICGEREARKHGDECRRCYKTNMQRKYRHERPDEEKLVVLSLDAHMYELDRLAYRDWMNGEY